MRVSDLMNRDIAVVTEDARLIEAVRLLIERRISSVIVEPRRPEGVWGILTHRDIVGAIAARGLEPSEIRVGSIMRPAFLLVDPSLNVGYASRLMRRYRIRHLLVMEGLRPIGILSYHDVLSLFSLVRRIAFFERLTGDDIVALMNLAALRLCEPGAVLIQEGEVSRDLFILEEGELVVSTKRAGRIARIRAGEIFGEMELFGGTRSAVVRSIGPSRVIVIDGERFLKLAVAREHLGTVFFETMSRLLSERLRRANRYLFLRGIWAHRAYVLRASLIAAGVFLMLVFATATISEQPTFCKSCHYMQPYQASWSTSPHQETKCTTCHWSYGLKGAVRGKITGVAMLVRYATKTYDPKPKAVVADELCLRSGCHDGVVSVDRYRTSEGIEVAFPHAAHLSDLPGIGVPTCTSCHNHRGQPEHFSVMPATCYLCHLGATDAGLRACHSCHDFRSEGKGAGSEVRLDHSMYGRETDCLSCHIENAKAPTEVPEARCSECHLRSDPLPVKEMHTLHVRDEKSDCFDCHAEIEHPDRKAEGLFPRCESCHEEVHAAQENLYVGQGGEGVPGRPALMHYFQVKCTACHGPAHDRAGTSQADRTRASCIDCHDADVEDQARTWKTTIDRLKSQVGVDLRRFEDQAGVRGSVRDSTAWRLYDEARANYALVAADASASIHNFRYAQDLLRASEENVSRAMDLLNRGEGEQR